MDKKWDNENFPKFLLEFLNFIQFMKKREKLEKYIISNTYKRLF